MRKYPDIGVKERRQTRLDSFWKMGENRVKC